MSNWQTTTIGEIAQVGRGSSPRPISNSKYFENGTIPWVKIADATSSGKYLTETKQYVNEYGASFSRKLEKGSLILATSGTLGYVQLLGVEGCIHDGWLYLSDFKKTSPEFIYYLLKTKTDEFLNSAYGAAIQNINTTILKNLEISLPPMEVQEQILSHLKTLDDLIINNKQRIKILEEIAQRLYEEWFVNFKFPRFEKVKMVDSELGKIPEGWMITDLINISEHVIGQSPKSKFYNTESIGLPFHQGVSDFKDRFPYETTWCTETKRVANKGDILISVRAPVGRLNIANKKMVIGRGLHAVRSKENLQSYLFYTLERYFQINSNLGNGAIFKAVTKSEVQKINIIYDYSVAKMFNDVVRPIDDLIFNLSLKNDLLKETRDLLLPRLISGEIEV